jgi:hypothetical protein
MAALAVFAGNLSFSLFDGKWFQAYIRALRPGYKPPSRSQLSGSLLRQVYQETMDEVDPRIESSERIGLILDESTTINSDRVLDLFVNTDTGCFFKGFTDLGSETVSAEVLCAQLQDRIIQLVGPHNLAKVNAFSTDTCATMESLWERLEQISAFRNALFVPCESHSLQLLIKDLLEIPEFAQTHRDCANIVAYFKSASKQYALLRDFQQLEYSKRIALIISVITRWGTQFRMIERILQMQQALMAWSYDSRSSGASVWSIIQNPLFWPRLGFLSRLLGPIHKLQVESESDDAHLGQVLHRWLRIRADFEKICQDPALNQYLPDEEDLIRGILNTRENRQRKDFHVLAYYLTPQPFVERWQKGESKTSNSFLTNSHRK